MSIIGPQIHSDIQVTIQLMNHSAIGHIFTIQGKKQMIENYRPVANLCSVSKIFEKLILKRISELEVINGISVGGKQQHGFMKNKSTASAGLLLQSLMSRKVPDFVEDY